METSDHRNVNSAGGFLNAFFYFHSYRVVANWEIGWAQSPKPQVHVASKLQPVQTTNNNRMVVHISFVPEGFGPLNVR